MACEVEAAMDQLQDLVIAGDKHVSYKYLSRHLDVNVTRAKQLLWHFSQAKGDEVVQCVHLLAGWTKADAPRHVVQLVQDAELPKARATLATVTSEHVYSVSPKQRDPVSELHNADALQGADLFNAPQEFANSLRDNRHAAVQCEGVTRQQGRRRNAVPEPSAAVAKNTAPPPAAKTAPAPTAAAAPAKPASKPAAKSFFGAAAGAAKPTKQDEPPAPAPTSKQAKGGKSKIASMFAKAPAPKPKEEKPAPPPPPPSADAAIAAAESDDDDDDDDDDLDDIAAVGRASGRTKRGRCLEDSPAKASPVREQPLTWKEDAMEVNDGSGDEEDAPDSPGAVRAQQLASAPAASPAAGRVKCGGAGPVLPQKRKVMRTFINDDGEEETVVEWEEVEGAAEAPPAPAEAPNPVPAPAAAPVQAPAPPKKAAKKSGKPQAGIQSFFRPKGA